MNFDFSDGQKALRDEARRFLADRCPRQVVRAVLDGPQPHDDGLWRGIAALGWAGAAVPEVYGGLGLGHLELCVLAGELGRSLAPVPFASSIYLCAEALLLAGSEAQKRRWLPRLAAGEAIGTLAVAETAGPPRLETIHTAYTGGRDGGTLGGVKAPVPDGMAADLAVVVARSGDLSLSAYLCDLTGEGVRREPLETLDPTRKMARLEFDGADAEPLGWPGQGLDLLERLYDRAAVLFAFEQVGGADACLEMARAYALERYAFSRPIASYQAVRHRLADMYVKTELARSNAYYGAWALSTGAVELPVAAAAARVAALEAYRFAARETIQVHGGMGFTWEFDCHLHYRRERHLSALLGGPPRWKDRLVRRLEARNAA